MEGLTERDACGVDLYWLPLGAGGHSVRLNGLLYESVVAAIARRRRYDLYHSALEVRHPRGRFVIEMTPVLGGDRADHGAVAEGAVGSRVLRRARLFRYEVRRWRDGVIPDVAEAVDSPSRVTDDIECAQRVLELVPLVPTPTWGRDELKTGDMWNSNSLISWLIVSAGLDVSAARFPVGGRAPGWDAGIAVAARTPEPDLTLSTWCGRPPVAAPDLSRQRRRPRVDPARHRGLPGRTR